MRPLVLVAALGLVAGCSSGGHSATPSSPAVASTSAAPSSVPGSPSRSVSPTPSRPALRQGPPKLALVGRFTEPVYVTSPPGDPRLFVVEQVGRIQVLAGGKAATFLDIRGSVLDAGEQGLLSMAFPPDFATSRRFYVHYNARDGDVRLAEFRVGRDPNRADPATRRELLRIDKPYPNHNGGLVLFDRAGMLLFSTGDGGSANDPGRRAQNLGDLHGKILRIDPHASGGRAYGIPKDNPYVARSGARPEVWAYGLRNPWRFSFDPDTGDLYVGDVGQNEAEEVDVVPPGRQPGTNYGWRVYEGTRRNFAEPVSGPGRLVGPVHTYDHSGGRCAVMGGVVYHGSVAALRGRYLFADHCSGEIWYFRAGTSGSPAVSKLPFSGRWPTTFGVDAAGEVYLASQTGEVWRFST